MEAINTIVMQHLQLRKKDRRFNNSNLVLIDSEAKTKDLVNQESVPLCPE